jgi:HEAT repeat protein
MTLTPIERRLEDATVVYIKAQAWQATIGLSAELARLESNNANAWFGIGSSLWRLSLNDPTLLEPTVAALKRAVKENKQFMNNTYKQLLFSASQSATKAGLNVESIVAFKGDPKHFAEVIEFTPQTLIDATRTLNVDSRVQIVSVLSEVPGELVEALLTDLSENDENSSVRTVASRALRERPQKPVAPEPVSAVGSSPEAALDAAAEESAESPVDEAEPTVTMVDTPVEEVASAIPNITEVVPTSTTEEVIESSASDTAAETPAAPVEAPTKPDPRNEEAIRAQLEARKQRLMGKK